MEKYKNENWAKFWVLRLCFFKINRIPIKSYFLMKKKKHGKKWGNVRMKLRSTFLCPKITVSWIAPYHTTLVNFSIPHQLFHIFECFVPWKVIIFNLTLCFQLNYSYSSLKSLLILLLEPKKNILTVQNRKSDVFQKIMM